LVELTQQIADKQGSILDAATARALLERLFPSQWRQAAQNRAYDKPPSIELIESETTKLALAAFPGPITMGLIDDLVPARAEERIFPLLDAVISGNQRTAVLETSNALRAGEDAARTMAQIYQQIELGVGASAAGRPSDPQQAGRALGVANAYRVTKVTEAAQRSRIAPARQLRLALDIDRRLKTGRLRNPDEALVDLVVQTTQTQRDR
jgi:DNA polymerase III delta subunit